MNKYQEAYGSIINSIDDSDVVLLDKSLDAIHELIDRATPKKPLHLHALKQFGVCPACNASVSTRHHSGFCGKCGNALDWGD